MHYLLVHSLYYDSKVKASVPLVQNRESGAATLAFWYHNYHQQATFEVVPTSFGSQPKDLLKEPHNEPSYSCHASFISARPSGCPPW